MSKQHPADAEAARLFSLREELGQTNERRAAHFFTVTALSLFISVLGLLVIALPQKRFSENENRLLSELPALSVESIAGGKFTKQLSDFCSDHFPLRDGFVAVASYTELLLGRREANGVVRLEGGALAERRHTSLKDRASLQSTLGAIEALKGGFTAESVVAVVPDALTAQSKDFYSPADELDKDFIYLSTDEENTYFKTDHHRTAYGSYLAYTALGEALGYLPYPAHEFARETVSDAFCGTAWSRSGLYLTPPESLELWRYDGDGDFFVTGDLTQNGFYDFSKLSGKDKYAVFFGGNYGHIEITDGTGKPRLLVIKDSFANALLPFLARHFELCVVDPRYFYGDINELAAGCDKVLFFYGINSLITDRELVRLTLE